MNFATIVELLEDVPEAFRVVQAYRAVAATPQWAALMTEIAAAQTLLDAKPKATQPEIAPASSGGHPHGTDSGRMPPGV